MPSICTASNSAACADLHLQSAEALLQDSSQRKHGYKELERIKASGAQDRGILNPLTVLCGSIAWPHAQGATHLSPLCARAWQQVTMPGMTPCSCRAPGSHCMLSGLSNLA